MKSDSTNANSYTVTKQVVIADECGDSLWDVVLKQEVTSGEMKEFVTNADSLLNRITGAQVSPSSTEEVRQRKLNKTSPCW